MNEAQAMGSGTSGRASIGRVRSAWLCPACGAQHAGSWSFLAPRNVLGVWSEMSQCGRCDYVAIWRFRQPTESANLETAMVFPRGGVFSAAASSLAETAAPRRSGSAR